MITIPQILLGLLVLGLFTSTFYVCFRSTKGPVSILNLNTQLMLLKRKFENGSAVNPDEERSTMEALQNRAKTSCSREVISNNKELRELFFVICRLVNAAITTSPPGNKKSWLQYGALMNDFNDQYFNEKANWQQ